MCRHRGTGARRSYARGRGWPAAVLPWSALSRSLAERVAHGLDEQRRAQRTPQPRQRRQLLLCLGARLGVPLPDVLQHHLLEQTGLAFGEVLVHAEVARTDPVDRKSTRLNSSHLVISYA